MSTPGTSVAARRRALITGASAGIGAAFAEEFAAHGYDLILVARREQRLLDLAARLTRDRQVHVATFACDLSEPDAVTHLLAQVRAAGLGVDALVNNAGYGVPGRYLRSDWDVHRAFIQVMMTAVAELTYGVLPGMLDRGYGRIVNVASLAGFVPPSAGHTLYGASKSFVIRFSESLALEVAGQGVHVTALCPGFTYSEFHDVNGMRAKVSRMPAFLWMDAARVAREGYLAVEAGKTVWIPGRVNRTIARLSGLLPGFVVHAVNRYAGKAYRDSS